MKRALAALAILAVLAVAAALAALLRPGGPPEPPRRVDPVRIGVSLGLTGRYAAPASMQEQGFRLWAKQQNLAGGLLGRPVKLLVRDDSGSPENAQAIYREFIRQDRMDFLFAPYSSELTRAVAGLVGRHGFPLIASGAATDSLWDDRDARLVGLLAPASRYAQGFLELLAQRGVTRLALFVFPGLFPEEAGRGAAAWATRLGLEVVYRHRVGGATPDLAAAVVAARAAGAEAVLLCGYARDADMGRRAVSGAGWRPRALYATVGPTLEDYGGDLGRLAEGVFSASHWEPGLPYPDADRFARDFLREYGRPASYHAAAAYAAGQLLARAVEQCRSTERSAVADALSSLDTVTVLGHFAVDPRGMQLRHFPVTIQWQDGRKAVVWPRDLATAEPVIF